MNRRQAIEEIDELIEHAQELSKDICDGHYDKAGDLSYAVGLGHLLDHLSRAWHFAQMTDEEIDNLSQAEFEKLTYSIPKLNGNHKLVELHEKVV